MPDDPKPGSQEAVKMGCTCPQEVNSHGQGYQGQSDNYVVNQDCPIHSSERQGRMSSGGSRQFRANDQEK